MKQPAASNRSGEGADAVLDHRALHRTLADCAAALASPRPTGELLAQLVANTIDVVGDVAAGVSLTAGDDDLQAFTASGPAVERIHADPRSRLGPGHDAFTTGQPVRCDDLDDEQRWPHYQAAVLDAGFRAVACVPLQLGDGVGGALEMYAPSPRGWTDADIEAAALLVDVSVGYIRIARDLNRARTLSGQLQHALDSRIVIEQAKGVIAHSRHITVSDAFELLRAHSRSHNRTVHDLALAVVDGLLDPERLGPPTSAADPASGPSVPQRAPAPRDPSNLARLLDAVREGVMTVDPAGLIRLVNEPALRMTGYHRSELIGQPVEMLLPDKALQIHRQHRDDYQRSGHPTRPMGQGPDITLRRADGTELTVDISLTTIDTPQGHLVVASIRDVTDPLAAEDTVTPDREHWRTIVEQIELFVVELDLEGRVRHVNPHTLTVTGYTADQVVGADWFRRMVPDEERDELSEVFRNVLHQRHRSDIHHNLITTADGRPRRIAWFNTLTRDRDGAITGVLSVGRDITDE